MRIEVLGCSGGIGGDARTTCLRIDDDILIDSGTGLGELPLADLARIDHIFLTHSHLDHIACLPLLLDSVAGTRSSPVTVHGRAETLNALRAHVFNGVIWPDFTRLPSIEAPFVVLEEYAMGSVIEIGARRFRPVEVSHTIPAVGYLVSSAGGTIALSGDTAATEGFWSAVNACTDMRYVIVETTFLDCDAELAEIAKHLCPRALAGELAKYRGGAPVLITHLMPGAESAIMEEIARHLPKATPTRLTRGQVLTL